MLILAGVFLRVLALGMQVVPASGLRFNFTEVQQCQQFIVPFAGSNLTNASIPASLLILPINSTAISVPLQNPSLVSNGVFVSSIPLPAGSNFLTSLDDETGENLISVSDLIRVVASEQSSTSCLPQGNSDEPRRFAIASEVAQCEELTINYDTTVVPKAPVVRLYNPKGSSSLLNMTSDNTTVGSARYLVNFARGKEILLLVDGSGFRETSTIITVGGDAASNSACLRKPVNMANVGSSDGEESDSTPIPSKAIIIGGTVGGGVVGLIALAMIIFVIRDRRRRRKNQADVETSQWEKSIMEEEKSQQVSNSRGNSPGPGGTVANPIYAVNSSFLSPTNSKFQRGSMSSWVQVVSEDHKVAASTQVGSPQSSSSRILVQSPRSENRVSLQSLDIEGMLNMATLQFENNPSRKNSTGTVQPLATLSPSPSLAIPVATYLAPDSTTFHRRDPSDVPAGPVSMTFSGYSVNPFDSGRNSITPSILESSLRTSRPVGGVGLPVNPRDVGSPSKGRVLSGASGRGSSDWYGIAR